MSGTGDLDGAVVLGAPDPIEAHEAVEQRPSDAGGQVMALFAPIDAVSDWTVPTWLTRGHLILKLQRSRRTPTSAPC
jgi:hypothetical protein